MLHSPFGVPIDDNKQRLASFAFQIDNQRHTTDFWCYGSNQCDMRDRSMRLYGPPSESGLATLVFTNAYTMRVGLDIGERIIYIFQRSTHRQPYQSGSVSHSLKRPTCVHQNSEKECQPSKIEGSKAEVDPPSNKSMRALTGHCIGFH